MPKPLSALVHIRPVALSVMVWSPLSTNWLMPQLALPRTHWKKNVLFPPPRRGKPIALDPAIREIHAKEQRAVDHADIEGARGVLRIDDALAGAGIAVGKLEVVGV